MTEREYQVVLDTVQSAINRDEPAPVWAYPGEAPVAANDNDVAWPLLPFPEGWHASP